MERSGGDEAEAPTEGVVKDSSPQPTKSMEASVGRASQCTPRPPGKALGAPGRAGLRTPGGRVGNGSEP